MRGGKVQRAPDYDQRKIADDPVRGPMPMADDTSAQFKAGLYRSDERNHTAARAELVAFGVDGNVTFMRAAENVGPMMLISGSDDRTLWATKRATLRAANDNQKIAVAA